MTGIGRASATAMEMERMASLVDAGEQRGVTHKRRRHLGSACLAGCVLAADAR